MAVDISDMMALEVFAALRRQGDAAAAVSQSISQGAATFLNILDRVMLQQFTEVVGSEAEAISETRRAEAARGVVSVAAEAARGVADVAQEAKK